MTINRNLERNDNAYPHPKSAASTASMRGNKKKDTRPELRVRKWLRDGGFPGYRLHWRVVGSPDIVYPRRKIAVFVHGCFWHGCERCAIKMPLHNSGYWQAKIGLNRARDMRSARELCTMGWHVFTIWECRTRDDGPSSIRSLLRALECGQVNDAGHLERGLPGLPAKGIS